MSEFWKTQGEHYVIPSGNGDTPEGFDIHETLSLLASRIGYQKVVDLGCGYGRLCKSFHPDKYLGIDINEKLLRMARSTYEEYDFSLPKRASADICLVYTLLLHLRDEEILEVVGDIDYKYLIVGEILGREWRNERGIPPTYNRNIEDYIKIMDQHSLKEISKYPYMRYRSDPKYKNMPTDLYLLVFKKIEVNDK